MKIKLIKFNDNLIYPCRAHYNDAGIDCFALEDFDLEPFDKFATECGNPVKFIPKTTEIVPLGFGLEVPDGYMATIRPRSSMNAKGIITQIGTIDSGYRGEIKAVFINLGNNTQHFKKGDKICQIVIEPVILAEFTENITNDRGTGGFGSTNG